MNCITGADGVPTGEEMQLIICSRGNPKLYTLGLKIQAQRDSQLVYSGVAALTSRELQQFTTAENLTLAIISQPLSVSLSFSLDFPWGVSVEVKVTPGMNLAYYN